MTRCVACDHVLNDFEATRKAEVGTGKYYYPDLCNKCFKASDLAEFVPVVERSDLQHEEDIYDSNFDDVEFDEYSTPYGEHTWEEEDEE